MPFPRTAICGSFCLPLAEEKELRAFSFRKELDNQEQEAIRLVSSWSIPERIFIAKSLFWPKPHRICIAVPSALVRHDIHWKI